METNVKLYNRNKFDYKEVFQGETIIIKAGGFVTMDYEKANRFMGKFNPIKKDKGGNQLPESYKWLEMDPEDKKRAEYSIRNESEEKASKIFVCAKCGEEFKRKENLIKHVRREHSDDLVDDKTREELEDLSS